MPCLNSLLSSENVAISPIESAEALALRSPEPGTEHLPHLSDSPGGSHLSSEEEAPLFSCAARALLIAAGTNHRLEGSDLLLPALLSCISAAEQIWPNEANKAWVLVCLEIQRLRCSPEISQTRTLELSIKPKTPTKQFEQLSRWRAQVLHSGPLYESSALLGRGLIQSAVSHQVISADFLAGLVALLKARAGKGKHLQDWSGVLQASLVDSQDLRKIASRLSRENRANPFIKLAIGILETPSLPPATSIPTNPSAEESGGWPDEFISPRTAQFPEHVTVKPVEVLPQESVPDVMARLAAAEYCGFAEKLGISHRDHLLVNDLADICGQLGRHLVQGSPTAQGFAILAILSLITGCTDEAALELGFFSGHNIWLDLEKGAWAWDFNVYKLSKPDSRETEANPVYCPWPALLDRELASARQNNPAARTLRDLVLAVQGRDSFDVAEFRKFLRGCGHSSHPPFRGRFARSLAYAYLEVTGSDMTTALMSCFFAATAPAALFYYGPSYKTLGERTSKVYQRLGLGPPSALFNEHGRAGCQFLLPPSVLRSGWYQLIEAINRARLAAYAATEPAARVDHCNCWLGLVAAAFIIQTAHRATRLGCLTAGALFTHPDALIVQDKDDVDRVQPRLIPKTATVTLLLKSAIECHHVITTLARDGPQMVCHDWQVSDPVFIRWEILGAGIAKEVLSTSCIASITERYFSSRPNFGRSQWVTYLDDSGCDRWLVRALTGHARDVTRVSGAYLDIAPLIVAGRLCTEMEKVGLYLFGETAIPIQEVSEPAIKLSMMQARTPHKMLMGPVPDPRTILEPLTVETLVEWKLATRIRAALISGNIDASEEVLSVLHLVYVDQIPDQVLCIDAVTRPKDTLKIIGRRTGLNWKRHYFVHDTWLPIQPTTACLLGKTGNSTVTAATLIAQVCTAVRALTYGRWPVNDAKCWAAIGITADGFRRLSFPPSICMVSDAGVAAPCLSMSSIWRLAGVPAHQLLQVPSQRASGHKSARKGEDSRFLIATLGKCASSTLRHGEKRARALKCLKELDGYDSSWSPFIDWIKTFVVDELRRSRDQLADSFQISSIRTYCSTLLCCQFEINLEVDPTEWNDNEWSSWVIQVEQNSKTDETLSSGDEANGHLHHRAKYALLALVESLQRRQEYVPFAVRLQLEVTSQAVTPHSSASSCLILAEDHPRCLSILKGWHSEHPVDFSLVEGRSLLSTMVPLRTGDSASLSNNCLTPHGGLVIERAGYNVHKTQNAIRIVPLSDAQSAVVRAKLNELNTYLGARRLLFRGDGSPAAGHRDQRLAADWSAALKQATGDPAARPHSIRAATLQEIAWPGWQGLATQALNGEVTPRGCRIWTEEQARVWDRLATAAAVSGQGGLRSAAGNYLAGWHLVYSFHASASLHDTVPGPKFLQQLGIKDTALRQARSRAKRRVMTRPLTESIDEWGWVTAQIMRVKPQGHSPSSEALATDRAKAFETLPLLVNTAPAAADTALQKLRYLALRSLGMASEMALEKINLTLSSRVALERVLPSEDLIAEAVARTRQGPEGRAQVATLTLAESDNGLLCLSWLRSMDLTNYRLIRLLFFREGLVGHNTPNLSMGLRKIAPSIPTEFSLNVQMGAAHVKPAELSALASVGPALNVITNPRIGARPVVSLQLRNTKNQVVRARLTALIRIHFLVIDAYRELAVEDHSHAC